MRAMSAVLVLAVAVLLIAAAPVSGQVPREMNYQVMLTNDSDEPLADQAVALEFRIYDAESGGSMKWSEAHNPTTNSIGVVSVVLGETTPLGAYFDMPLWLEIEVDSETLSPRRPLLSAPYALYSDDAENLGGESASAYVLGTDLSTAGSINNPANPVDWTKLKSVPAGFADGADDVGGTGDGHSLDAVDGNPVDAVYVNSVGNVGIGVTTPSNRLTVSGLSGLSYAQFANTATGYGVGDGLEVGINGSGYAFINQQEALSLSFMTGAIARAKLGSDGVFEFGSSVSNGVAEFYAAGGAGPSVLLSSNPANGGFLGLYEESGTRFGVLEPDANGTGGFFKVYDGGGSNGFYVNGNFTDDSAYFGATGAGSTIGFNSGASGNSSVLLPTSAISAGEILDEAGAASATLTSGFLLSGPVEALLSRSIAVPASGYVLAMASAEIEIDHGVTFSGASFGVSSSSSSFPTGGAIYHRVPPGATQGVWMPGVSVQGIFPVSAGTNTFYFLGDLVGGDWTVLDRKLSLVYIPTAYGSVTQTVAAPPENPEQRTAEPGHALTEADIAAERAESEAFNNARIGRELAEMEARIEEIRASMGNGDER